MVKVRHSVGLRGSARAPIIRPMIATYTRFEGSIPTVYDELLGPLLFEPYAEDLALRVSALGALGAVLETAAGTGIVTRALARVLSPSAKIVATDLNEAMLKVAAAHTKAESVRFQPADAQRLPFGDEEFDAVVCQFGIMFFPDKAAGFREARRVLKAGGHLVFNVWDRLDRNDVSQAAGEAVAALFPADPPRFMERVPFGWNDADQIRRELESAGFGEIAIEQVEKTTRAPSAAVVAAGLCKGTPLRNELEARANGRLDAITSAVSETLTARYGSAPFDQRMSALVVVARAPSMG